MMFASNLGFQSHNSATPIKLNNDGRSTQVDVVMERIWFFDRFVELLIFTPIKARPSGLLYCASTCIEAIGSIYFGSTEIDDFGCLKKRNLKHLPLNK